MAAVKLQQDERIDELTAHLLDLRVEQISWSNQKAPSEDSLMSSEDGVASASKSKAREEQGAVDWQAQAEKCGKERLLPCVGVFRCASDYPRSSCRPLTTQGQKHYGACAFVDNYKLSISQHADIP